LVDPRAMIYSGEDFFKIFSNPSGTPIDPQVTSVALEGSNNGYTVTTLPLVRSSRFSSQIKREMVSIFSSGKTTSLSVSSFYLAEVPEQHLFHYLEEVCPDWVEIVPQSSKDAEHPGTVTFSSSSTFLDDKTHIPHKMYISFTVVKEQKQNPEKEETGLGRIFTWDFLKKTFTLFSSSSASDPSDPSYPSYPWFIIKDIDGDKEKKGETKTMVSVLLHPSFFDREG